MATLECHLMCHSLSEMALCFAAYFSFFFIGFYDGEISKLFLPIVVKLCHK